MTMVSESLKGAVETADIVAVRSSFYTIILSDPRFKTGKFDEALEYVKARNLEGFIDEHDGEVLKDKEEWNEEYFDSLVSRLQDNFSEERIEQIKAVAKKLSAADTEKNSAREKKKTEKSSARKEDSGYWWVGVLAGIAVIGFILRKLFKGGK